MLQPFGSQPLLGVLGDTPATEEARFLAYRLNIRLRENATETPVVLVATQRPRDRNAPGGALRGKATHVLMIASRRKAGKLRAEMHERGVGEQHLVRLDAPTWQNAGAKTSAEIAWAAMVRVFAIIRDRKARRLQLTFLDLAY